MNEEDHSESSSLSRHVCGRSGEKRLRGLRCGRGERPGKKRDVNLVLSNTSHMDVSAMENVKKTRK